MRIVSTKSAWIAGGIAFVAFLLAVCYGVVTPLWEGQDEPIHFDVVQFIAEHHRLPTLFDEGVNLGQTLQPPLFYTLAAVVVNDVDMSDSQAVREMNPFFWGLELGDEHAYGIHSADEGWPWTGTALAVHRVRILQAVFIFGSVIATYLAGRELFPHAHQPAIIAACVAGFIPGFIKIHSYANNDALLAMLAGFMTLVIVRAVTRGVSTRRSLAAGILLGLMLLTKQSIVFVVPIYFLLICRDALRERSVRTLALQSLVALAPILLLIGWWYLRNLRIYGDPLGMTYYMRYAINPPFPEFTAGYVMQTLMRMVENYWGRFGWGTIRMGAGIYLGYSALFLIALAGIPFRARRVQGGEKEAQRAGAWSTALKWLALIWVAVSIWYMIFLTRMGPMALQSRYFYPAHAAFSVFFAGGLWQLIKDRGKTTTVLAGVFCAYLFLVAVLAPFLYISPVFAGT